MKHLYLLFFLSIVTISCSREMVMDTMEEPRVVVECVLSNQSVQTLRLSYTKGASMDEAPVLREAEASLTDLTTGEDAGNFVRQDDGTWTLDYSAVPLHSYRLEVRVPGHELIWAEQTMPTSYPWTESYHTYAYNPASKQYLWIWAMKYDPDTGKREYVERICTDLPFVDDFNLTGDLYIPQTADTNYYGAPGESKLYPALEGKPLHKRFLRIDFKDYDDISQNYEFEVSGDFHGDFFHNYFALKPTHYIPYDDEGYLAAANVSPEFDRYLRDAVYLQQLAESSDLSSIYIRDNIFTNISGGLGIFGAYTGSQLEWAYWYVTEE